MVELWAWYRGTPEGSMLTVISNHWWHCARPRWLIQGLTVSIDLHIRKSWAHLPSPQTPDLSLSLPHTLSLHQANWLSWLFFLPISKPLSIAHVYDGDLWDFKGLSCDSQTLFSTRTRTHTNCWDRPHSRRVISFHKAPSIYWLFCLFQKDIFRMLFYLPAPLSHFQPTPHTCL